VLDPLVRHRGDTSAFVAADRSLIAWSATVQATGGGVVKRLVGLWHRRQLDLYANAIRRCGALFAVQLNLSPFLNHGSQDRISARQALLTVALPWT
jgi:hypothetical protein